MPVFLIPWIIRGVGVLAVMAVIGVGWYKAEHWCNAACRDLKDNVVSLQAGIAERDASIALTQKRAADLAMLWSHQVDKTENATHIAEASRVQEFGKLATAAQSIPAGARAHFGGVAIGVFDDSRRGASGEATGSAAKPAEAAPAPASSAEEFVVSLYEWAAVCRARVDEWSQFYAGLQAASGSVSGDPRMMLEQMGAVKAR